MRIRYVCKKGNIAGRGRGCRQNLHRGKKTSTRRLLQWIARIKNGLKLRSTTRYRTCSNQISTRVIPIRYEIMKNVPSGTSVSLEKIKCSFTLATLFCATDFVDVLYRVSQ